MASRMDRYTKSESTNVPSARSDRNKSLYKQIEQYDSYTNIAGVATIENKNSIDLEKVRELLKNVESKEEVIVDKEKREPVVELEEEKRNYDIKELLSKMKSDIDKEEQKYRSLSSKQKKVLKELNEKNSKIRKLQETEDELDKLVKTLTNMSPVTDEDDVGLFDDLKSDTMVGDASSIKKIIEEEKEFTQELDEVKLDKSFYTSSFGFTQKDFEELKDINHKIKKDNKKIITLLVIIIALITIGTIYFIIK
jgi:hypothetical protein